MGISAKSEGIQQCQKYQLNVDIENILIQRENQYKIVMQLTVENLTKKDMKKLRKLSTFIFKDKFILHRIECSFKTTQDFGKSYPNKRILIYNVYRVERKKTTYSPAKKIDWFLNSIK